MNILVMGGKKRRRKICLELRLPFWAVRIQNQQVERKWRCGDSQRVSGEWVWRPGWLLSPWFGWEGKVVASAETESGTMRKWNDFHFELVRIGCLWASKCGRQFCKTTPTTPLLKPASHEFSYSKLLSLTAALRELGQTTSLSELGFDHRQIWVNGNSFPISFTRGFVGMKWNPGVKVMYVL